MGVAYGRETSKKATNGQRKRTDCLRIDDACPIIVAPWPDPTLFAAVVSMADSLASIAAPIDGKL
jgi:hypothetical protein